MKNWWAMWLILEISSIAFLLIIVKEKINEKIFNFFIFQALASALLIISIFLRFWGSEKNEYYYMKLMVTISMLLKIGMFPFQGWIINFIKNFSWLIIIILLTWQKLIPIIILVKNDSIHYLKTLLIIAMFIIRITIMKISQPKMIITLSSLIHNRWMFMRIIITKIITIFYLRVYSIISIILMKLLKINFRKFFSTQKTKKEQNIELISSFIAIAGIPPSIGFLVKISIIMLIIMSYSLKIWLIVIFIGSCIRFYIYFTVFIKNLMLTKKREIKNLNIEKINKIKMSMFLRLIPILTFI